MAAILARIANGGACMVVGMDVDIVSFVLSFSGSLRVQYASGLQRSGPLE